MDSGRDPYSFSSHHRILSAEDISTSSRILQHSSGNRIFESISGFPKREDDERSDTKEAPSIFEPRVKNRHRESARSRTRKARRGGPYPWDLDPTFIRWEHNSDRYKAYRAKAKQNSDQVWPDEVEDCLQYGEKVFASRDFSAS